MRSILLSPGPVSLSQTVRKAAVSTDLCHQEPEYFELQDRVRDGLLDVYDCDGDRWSAVLLSGSGLAALEAMLASLLPHDTRLLVIENGFHAERISRIAGVYKIEHSAVRHEWTESIDFERLEQALDDASYTHVAAVHHETTTGRLNDVFRLSELCEQRGLQLMLDTVSSFGAESIPFRSPALAACAGTAEKCLHGIPGLSFVLARSEMLELGAEPPRTLYLDLSHWLVSQDLHSTPLTPSVNAVLALSAALKEFSAQGGWQARHARYAHLAGRVERALASLGVERVLKPDESSCALHAYRIPEEMSFDQIHDRLKHWGFVIYGGQEELASDMFRISTMGDITDYDMERLLAALQSVFSG